MVHKPIKIINLSLLFPHKNCFDSFSTQIPHGSRIAIIGRNGCGKSTLLSMLSGVTPISDGNIQLPLDAVLSYVPQIIDNEASLSGGQRFNAALTKALKSNPNILLLDEPTNHLDQQNRKSLMRMIRHFHGTIIVATHDINLINECMNTLWHLENNTIQIFTGNYTDYHREIKNKRHAIEREISSLDQEKKHLHAALMKEQSRAAKSKLKGKKSIEQRKWPTIVSHTKASRSQQTADNNKAAISDKKIVLSEKLSSIRLPDVVKPKFHLNPVTITNPHVLSINNGSVRYLESPIILNNINLSMQQSDRISISGKNGSGKSTLVKAILNHIQIIRQGSWLVPKPIQIGYLDQHYQTLSPEISVYDSIELLVPTWTRDHIRCHLNDFLFRKNEEVFMKVKYLSGGEKARLSLAKIATSPPVLLMLDEITNNLDIESKTQVITILQKYPGAMLVISHDENFLNEISIVDKYQLEN